MTQSKSRLRLKPNTPFVTLIYPRSRFTPGEIKSFTNTQLDSLGYIAVDIKMSAKLSIGQRPRFIYT